MSADVMGSEVEMLGFSGGSTSCPYRLRNTLASGSQLMVYGLEVCYVPWLQVRIERKHECKSNDTPPRNQVGNAPGVMGRVRRVEILLQGIHDPACDSVLPAHKSTFTFCCVLNPSHRFTVCPQQHPKHPDSRCLVLLIRQVLLPTLQHSKQ